MLLTKGGLLPLGRDGHDEGDVRSGQRVVSVNCREGRRGKYSIVGRGGRFDASMEVYKEQNARHSVRFAADLTPTRDETERGWRRHMVAASREAVREFILLEHPMLGPRNL